MEKKEIKQETPAQPTEEQVANAVQAVDPNVVLRNLAFWLDIAIAKGRYIDLCMQSQTSKDAVPTPDNDKE